MDWLNLLFRHSKFLVLGLICFHFFEDSSQNCDSLYHGYSLGIMLTSPPGVAFGIYKTVQGIAQLVKNPPARQETSVQFLVGKIPSRRHRLSTPVFLGFPGGSAGKESACKTGDLVWSLGWEDPLEKGKVTHTSILAWRIPRTVQFKGSQKIGYDWETFTFTGYGSE